MYSKVLDKKQGDLIRGFSFLRKYQFYLAGDTALALHLGHRTSQDFDFYTKKEFKSRKFFDKKAGWEQVKKGIFEKVRNYQLGMFKK